MAQEHWIWKTFFCYGIIIRLCYCLKYSQVMTTEGKRFTSLQPYYLQNKYLKINQQLTKSIHNYVLWKNIAKLSEIDANSHKTVQRHLGKKRLAAKLNLFKPRQKRNTPKGPKKQNAGGYFQYKEKLSSAKQLNRKVMNTAIKNKYILSFGKMPSFRRIIKKYSKKMHPKYKQPQVPDDDFDLKRVKI